MRRNNGEPWEELDFFVEDQFTNLIPANVPANGNYSGEETMYVAQQQQQPVVHQVSVPPFLGEADVQFQTSSENLSVEVGTEHKKKGRVARASTTKGMKKAASSPSSKRKRENANSDDNEEKSAKRRAAIAAASRASRAKRKRELEELKQKNERLEKERESFLNTIADLQMKVQALRETGSIDLRMENDLLRAELMEHKNFISRFKRIADGMPTTNTAKKLMCKQGSDTAVAQVLGLLSTSMADPSWKIGTIPNHPEIDMRYQRLPHGAAAENAKRVSVRVDIPVVPVNEPHDLASIIWKMWCDEDLNARVSKHFGAVAVSVREIDTGIVEDASSPMTSPQPEPVLKEVGIESIVPVASSSTSTSVGVPRVRQAKSENVKTDEDSLKNTVKVYYYREETPRSDVDTMGNPVESGNDIVDTVLLLSARAKSISRSSFPHDDRFHKFPPKQRIEEYKVQDPFTLEEQQGLQAEANYEAIVLASTSTQHTLGLVPVKPGVNRIKSALLEGSIFRKVEGGVAMTSVFSFPITTNTVKGASRQDVLVTNKGELNPQWTKVVNEVYSIVTEHMDSYVFDRYRKVRDMGIALPLPIQEALIKKER